MREVLGGAYRGREVLIIEAGEGGCGARYRGWWRGGGKG